MPALESEVAEVPATEMMAPAGLPENAEPPDNEASFDMAAADTSSQYIYVLFLLARARTKEVGGLTTRIGLDKARYG